MLRFQGFFSLVAVFGMLFGGCASSPQVQVDSFRDLDEYDELAADPGAYDGLSDQLKDILETALDQVDHDLEPAGTVHSKSKIPLEMNKRVRRWIYYFSVKERDRFRRFMMRGERYRPHIRRILAENGVPTELYYLAMIESGFVTRARSHAGAVGVWQFIRATGKRYGLKQNHYVDERQDPLRATHAAAHYLKDLNHLFNNWYLAMAAYNAGEGRIFRAIMRGDTRNFWELASKGLLPRETMNYVPKYLAAAIIGRNPGKFGFDVPKADWILRPDLELAEVPGRVPLGKVANSADASLEELKTWNPHLRRGVTPAGKTYKVWVPKTAVAQLTADQSDFLAARVTMAAPKRAATGSVHKVRRGENLAVIAKRYGMRIRDLKRANRLRSNRIYVGQRLRVRGSSAAKDIHRVRRGENLGSIARRNGMSVRSLKRLNGLRSNRIYVGQRLKVSERVAKKRPARPSFKTARYRVRRGDTLLSIARAHRMKVSQLKTMNGMRSNRIYVGSKLKVRAHDRAVGVHRVRRGENLVEIAKRYGMSIDRLKGLNGIRRNRIYVGERLKVFRGSNSI
jgi:membrane-bound lytic murein transglycosylase D